MKIELLKPEVTTFKQIKYNETFVHAGSPYLRVRHTVECLTRLAGKKSVTTAGAGYAVNLSNGFVTTILDSTEVQKANFWLKEIK